MTSKFITRIIAIIISMLSYGGLFAQTSVLDSEIGDFGKRQLDKSFILPKKQLSDYGLRPIKHLPKSGAKSATVSFTATPSAESVTLTFDKNNDCYQYYVAVTDTGMLEQIYAIYTSFGMTVTYEELMATYVSQGICCTSDTSITITSLNPATGYSCYIWALASATDRTGVAILGNGFTTTVDGGSGTATIAVSNAVQDRSISYAIQCGTETGYFKMGYFDSISVARNGWTIDSLIQQTCQKQNQRPGITSMIIDELNKGTKYYSIFLPYNHNHQIGTVVIDTARTTGMSPAVDITNLQAEINSERLMNISFYATPNVVCTDGYDIWIWDYSLLSEVLYYNDLGYTIYDFEGADPWYSGTTAGEVRFTDLYLNPGTTYYVYIAAKGEDTVFDYGTTFVTPIGGGTGVASVDVSITNITTNSATLTTNPNDQTAYYYCLSGKSSSFASNGINDAEAVVDYMESIDAPRLSVGFSEQKNTLKKATEYTVWAVPFNQDNVMGNASCEVFTTLTVGINEANDIQLNVYPNPVSTILNIDGIEGFKEAILYNSLGQQVMCRQLENNLLRINVSGLAKGTYHLQLIGDQSSITTKVIVK